MATKLQHGDSLYQVIEKVNEIIDGTVQPGSGGKPANNNNTAASVSMLNAETNRATSAEQYLQDQIDTITNSIGISENGDESASNTSEDNELQSALIIEAICAAMAEQGLQDQIDNIDISGLQQAIDDEVARAQAAEQDLQDQIGDIATILDSLVSVSP